jgi:hypothetical protein
LRLAVLALLTALLAGLIALLLLLARLLPALLLATLLPGLIALLLLTRLLVLILAHSMSFQRWRLPARVPHQRFGASIVPRAADFECDGTRLRKPSSHAGKHGLRNARWDAICCFGFWGFRCRFCC